MEPLFEAVKLDGGGSFRCIHVVEEHFSDDHSWHFHPQYEITWIVRSFGTQYVGDDIRPYAPGDIVLLGPNTPHCWQNEPIMGQLAVAELVAIQFDRNFLGNAFLDIDEARAVRLLLERARFGIQFEGPIAGRAADVIRQITVARGLVKVTKLLELLDLLSALGGNRLTSRDYDVGNDIDLVTRERIDRIITYVRGNLTGTICQSQIAAELRLSSPAFSRFFRIATGQTFVGFVNTVRVNEACRLLSATNMQITQIAMECGYNNISNFNRQFLSVKRMSPSAFRLRARMILERTSIWSKLRMAS